MTKLKLKEKEFLNQIKDNYKTSSQMLGAFVLSNKKNIYRGVPYLGGARWIHGEENAIGTMIAEEGFKSKINIIAILAKKANLALPCGMCRVAIHKYSSKDTSILCISQDFSEVKKFTIEKLYPDPYLGPL